MIRTGNGHRVIGRAMIQAVDDCEMRRHVAIGRKKA